MCTCEQHTYPSSEHFHLEEGETMLVRGNENFRAPGVNRICDLSHAEKNQEQPPEPGYLGVNYSELYIPSLQAEVSLRHGF